MEDQANNPSSSPPPPTASNPPQPEPQPSPATSSNPSSPEHTKTNLEIVPISTPEANPNPISSVHPESKPTKKTPPLPWTHQETVSLIQTYQEKWYSLKKGQLKANQWEDVSAAVAARCGYDFPSKTATQCRHKIEKLRKRYRAERLKPYPNSWPYFELMDHLERGPMPIPPISFTEVKHQNQKKVSAAGFMSNYRENKNVVGDVNNGGFEAKKNKSKSVNNIVQASGVDMGYDSKRNLNKIGLPRNFGVAENAGILRGFRTPVVQKRKVYFQEDESDGDDDDEDDDFDDEGEELETEVEVGEKGRGGALAKALAAEIRGFAERFLKMENNKIEMMKETEKSRMEMEKKRMDMILEAQRKVVDTIRKAFGAHKKPKMMAPES